MSQDHPSPRGVLDQDPTPVRRSNTSDSVPTAVNSAHPSTDKLDAHFDDKMDSSNNTSGDLEKKAALDVPVFEDEDDVGPLPSTSPAPPSGRRRSVTSLTRSTSRLSRLSRTSTRRMSAGQATQLEMMLRVQTRESGVVSHSGGEGQGVVEKHAVVDMGDGPEEVIVIDWAPGDPEVSLEFGKGTERLRRNRRGRIHDTESRVGCGRDDVM